MALRLLGGPPSAGAPGSRHTASPGGSIAGAGEHMSVYRFSSVSVALQGFGHSMRVPWP